jgi:ribosomal protein S27E
MDLRLHCPGCGEEVDVAAESAGQLVRCPYCNTDFFASPEQSHLDIVDDTVAVPEGPQEKAVDQNRVARLAALRLGNIRARSWWVIGLGICVMAFLDALRRAALYVLVLHHWGVWPTVDVAIALLAIRWALLCRRRAADLKIEIDRSAISEPATPPDFSTLSDGRDRWKNLENVR